MRKCAKYNGKEYRYNENKGQSFILTNHIEKTDEYFKTDALTAAFWKQICIDDLSDIYGYQFIAIYDSHIDGVSKEWNTEDHSLAIYNSRVALSFYKDDYFCMNGWEKVDRSDYFKYVDISELLSAKIRFIYEKKDGRICNPPIVQEEEIKTSELNKYEQYFLNL